MFWLECRTFPGIQTIHQGPGVWKEDRMQETNSWGKEGTSAKIVIKLTSDPQNLSGGKYFILNTNLLKIAFKYQTLIN